MIACLFRSFLLVYCSISGRSIFFSYFIVGDSVDLIRAASGN